MARGRLAPVFAALAFLLAASGGAAAEVPPGPRLAVVRSGNPLPGDELLSTDPGGTHWFTLVRTPHASGAFEGLSWSGDGGVLAIGGYGLAPGAQIFTVGAAGGKLRGVGGTRHGAEPAFSPTGSLLAFSRYRFQERVGDRDPYLSGSIWLTNAESGSSRQLTPWRDGLLLGSSSFSPDGTSLVGERDERGNQVPEVVSVPLDGGPQKVIIRNGVEPTYSPDGSEIAFVRRTMRPRPRHLGSGYVLGGDLFVASANGSTVKRLTFTPSKREESPSWDPSGQRLAYAQFPSKLSFEALGGIGSSIMEINADGSCKRRLLFTYGLSYKEPAWQPGPGRGAGRIEC